MYVFICRRAIWYRLVNIVSPLASEMYAFTDYNENLHLLAKHPTESWKHRLWLAIFADPSLSPLHYTDFISPEDNVIRNRAPVKVMVQATDIFPPRFHSLGYSKPTWKSSTRVRQKKEVRISNIYAQICHPLVLRSVLNAFILYNYFVFMETYHPLKVNVWGCLWLTTDKI